MVVRVGITEIDDTDELNKVYVALTDTRRDIYNRQLAQKILLNNLNQRVKDLEKQVARLVKK